MNKSELIVKLNSKKEYSMSEVRVGVQVFFEQISKALMRGEKVNIKDFGTFNLRTHNAKLGYNPQNGRRFYISEKQVPHFRASAKLKAKLNEE